MCYIYSVRFAWDPAKAASNQKKHGVAFDEAATVLADPLAVVRADDNHAERSIIVGLSARERVLLCVYVEQDPGDTIRIISARRTTSHERRAYEEGEGR